MEVQNEHQPAHYDSCGRRGCPDRLVRGGSLALMLTKAFALAALERGMKSAAQSALLVFGADQVNALNANWADVGGFALGGFVLSILTSIASAGVGGTGPSLGAETLKEN